MAHGDFNYRQAQAASRDPDEYADDHDANRDPITGETGFHPVGTGVGAAVGGAAGICAAAAAGAAVGSGVGPVGTAVGAAVGALAGGLIGSAAGEDINPTEEEEYWRRNYYNEPDLEEDSTYELDAPAYRIGYVGRERYPDLSFEDVVSELRDNCYANRGDSTLERGEVREAARVSWHRIDERSGI